MAEPIMPANDVSGNRTCPRCGVPIHRRATDYPSTYAKRRYCSNHCARKSAALQDPEIRFSGRVDKTPGHGPNGDCHIWTGGRQGDGYGLLSVNGKDVLTHRYAYLRHYKIDPGSKFVCHKCDNPPCCNPDHLFLGDHQDNMDDMNSKGRANKVTGEDHSSSKLTASQVIQIRDDQRSAAAIARSYSVSDVAILKIKSRQTWKGL